MILGGLVPPNGHLLRRPIIELLDDIRTDDAYNTSPFVIPKQMISQPSTLDDSSEKSRRLSDICHSAIALVICMTSPLMVGEVELDGRAHHRRVVCHRNAQDSGNT
ncbi:predicted protein [Histoplasma capsulatum G186AR]|uniref:Uncharacterized protein n=1 Tax=Ajellomyces capsulatus (strain G186AR / H82 / ATCC MYA-2454 / RMSCC 2432) TaxID=447093 RepID=C0NI26_AJECG|nr:uncharacterized protein HCBG_02998 [Histoplasma capsulatum G186AR]EEH09461.1 predicted protein [Histoplasma capsulatum G186AR]